MTTDLKAFGEKLAPPLKEMSTRLERMTQHPIVMATMEMSKLVLCQNGLHADERGLDNVTDCINIADCATTLAVARAHRMQLDDEAEIAEIDRMIAEMENLIIEGCEMIKKRIGMGNQPNVEQQILGVAIIDLTGE